MERASGYVSSRALLAELLETPAHQPPAPPARQQESLRQGVAGVGLRGKVSTRVSRRQTRVSAPRVVYFRSDQSAGVSGPAVPQTSFFLNTNARSPPESGTAGRPESGCPSSARASGPPSARAPCGSTSRIARPRAATAPCTAAGISSRRLHTGGLMLGIRAASPRKISISTMQKISIGNSVRNRLSLSNFRCMK